jgi:hypothetical protein
MPTHLISHHLAGGEVSMKECIHDLEVEIAMARW